MLIAIDGDWTACDETVSRACESTVLLSRVFSLMVGEGESRDISAGTG